jgi:hypothetical protein
MITRHLRLIATALLLGCVARIWHVLILRLQAPDPTPLAPWLVAVFALVFVAARMGRNQTEPAGVLDRWWSQVDGIALLFLACFLLFTFVFDQAYERASSDGREYYVQVRSLLIDHDLSFLNENATFGVRGTASRYPFGATLLWAPFFLLCHVWLWVMNLMGGTFALDGYINPYQRAVGVGSLVYGCAGLVLAYKAVARDFPRWLAATATLAICCGAFYVWYVTVENSMVHAASWFGTTLFLYLFQRNRYPSAPRGWIALGVAAGLMTIVRWQNATFLVAPVVYWISRAIQDIRAHAPHAMRNLAVGGAVSATAGFLVFFPQLLFWKVVSGEWVAPPTAAHGFHPGSSHVTDVLFSPNHGLLSMTPLVYLALLGLPLYAKRDRVFSIVLAAGFLTQLWVNGAVEIWWGGAGFGARRFDNCLVVFVMGLAALLVWLREHPLVAPATVVGTFVAGNLLLMRDVKTGALPSAAPGMTGAAIANAIYEHIGNPFSFPANVVVGHRMGGGPVLYDRLAGHAYNNVEFAFGTNDDKLFLTNGWLAPETGATGPFRWASGKSASVALHLLTAMNYRLTVICSPFTYPGRPPQTMDVLLNGRQVQRLTLDGDLREYQVDIPADALTAGFNRLTFAFGYSTSPHAVGLSGDTRSLAVMFASLQFRQQPAFTR